MFSSTNEVHIFFKKGHLFFFFSVSCLCYELHSTWIFNVVVSFNCWYRRYHIIFHFIRQFLKFHEQFFKKKTSATHSSPNLRLFWWREVSVFKTVTNIWKQRKITFAFSICVYENFSMNINMANLWNSRKADKKYVH